MGSTTARRPAAKPHAVRHSLQHLIAPALASYQTMTITDFRSQPKGVSPGLQYKPPITSQRL